MTPNIKNLGTWVVYTPVVMPEWTKEMPDGFQAIFVKRESDGIDWYDFRTNENNFTNGYLLATTTADPVSDLRIIQGVYRDRTTTAIPTNLQVIEIEDLDSSDPKPWKLYEQRTIDMKTLTIGDVWQPPIISVKDYQFSGQANFEGLLTDDETDNWVGAGIVPASLVDAVKKAVTDTQHQRQVLLFLKGTKAFPRFHELTSILGVAFGKDTPAKLDAFFLAASKR